MTDEKAFVEQPEHPLQYQWVWSYKPTIVYKQQTAEDWMADYRPLLTEPIKTVERFWAVYDHQPSLAQLDYGNIYSMFRDGILPVWEHPANAKGYSVVFYLNKTNELDYVNRLFQASLLTLIGNSHAFSSNLNGCTFERKTGGNKIVYWMSGNSDRLTTVKQIAQAIGVDKMEITLCDVNARIDWKNAKYAKFKVAVMCRSHHERANEPPPTQHNQQSKTQQHHHHRRQAQSASGGRQHNRK